MKAKDFRAQNQKLIILKKPVITEKATTFAISDKPVYVFEIPAFANKTMVKESFVERFNKKPVKINIINLPAQKVSVRGNSGTKSGKKKALVFLASGQTIDLV